jgi:hypothetical protein
MLKIGSFGILVPKSGRASEFYLFFSFQRKMNILRTRHDLVGRESHRIISGRFAQQLLPDPSEKESTCILPSAHPNVRVITCLSSTGM